MLLTYANGMFVWKGGYETRLAPKQAGFRWNPTDKVWYTVSATQAAKLRDEADEAARAALTKAIGVIELSAKTDAEIDIPRPEGLDYLGYQKAGIAYAAERTRTLIADEMGLGKTIQAIGLANLTRPRSILVICPASLKLNWKKEFSRWLTYAPEVLEVTNYERVKKLTPAQGEFELLIVDEAHYIKNFRAQRTKEVRRIAELCPRAVFLTGTPFLNRPIEIFNLVNLCAPEQFRSWKYFALKYCAGYEGAYGFEFGTPSQNALEELQSRMRETCMVRRLKADVLTELPPKRRQVIELEAEGKIARLIQTEREFFETASDKQTEGVGFSEGSRVRHELGLAKVEHAINHVKEIWDEDERKPVVVFTHHVDVAEAIANELGGVLVTGKQSPEERQAAVETFQAGKVDLFVGTIAAAGVGLTLTRSEHLVFVETDWVPANILQAEDRIHRIGQTASVLIQYLVFSDSLDCHLLKVFADKQAVIEKGLNGVTSLKAEKVEWNVAKVSVPKVEKKPEAPQYDKETKKAVLEALRFLASRCDGAIEDDGQGFNGLDSRFGKDLAAREFLTDRQTGAALKMLKKYRGQLSGAGFNWSFYSAKGKL